MSKYDPLWQRIRESGKPQLQLTFDEIEEILGFPLDHAFLQYKKELTDSGYEVRRISLKARMVFFDQRKELP